MASSCVFPRSSSDMNSGAIHCDAVIIGAGPVGLFAVFELGLLDAKARKGKIPRRQYKKQIRKLEARSSIISKDIAESKGVFLSAGGNYASLIRQLDGAETELKTVERKIKDAEARNRSGVTSSGEYKKELADYQQRKDNSEALITGILLRLREETR